MRYVLLTWNPGPEDDEQYSPEQWLNEMVLPLQHGRLPEGDRWSIGTNWKTIKAGDLVCMFRQGAHGRGIVATGVITQDAFRDAHWSPDRSGDAWYVSVAWNRAWALNQMMTIGELARAVPGFAWNQVYSSGRIVDGPPALQLASLLGHGPPPATGKRKSGQVYGTAEHNRLVEQEAMKYVSTAYRTERYVVRDVSKKNLGWDLEARRGKSVSYIEVKGVTGDNPSFFLTANEHRAASDQDSWLAVVITEVFSEKPGVGRVFGIRRCGRRRTYAISGDDPCQGGLMKRSVFAGRG